MKRILCFGSRTFDDREAVRIALCTVLGALVKDGAGVHDVTIVHGGATGADLLCAELAYHMGYPVEEHRAEWSRHGRRAGPIRNQQMLDLGVDVAIGFFDGATPGSMDMLRRLIEAHVVVRCVPLLEPRKGHAFPKRYRDHDENGDRDHDAP